MTELKLAFGIGFEDLYERAGLMKLDQAFREYLNERDAELDAAYAEARNERPESGDEAKLLMEVAAHLESFIGALFGISAELEALAGEHTKWTGFFAVKRQFVQRRAMKEVSAEDAVRLDGDGLAEALREHLNFRITGPDDEFAFAAEIENWLEDAEANDEPLALAAQYAGWALRTPEGRQRHGAGILFKAPKKLDFERLVEASVDLTPGYAVYRLPEEHLTARDGFGLTDAGADLPAALSEAHYCIYCHNQGKDSCATGLREKAKGGAIGPFKHGPLGVELSGCPLGVRISEMNDLKQRGISVGALAMLTIDNPMVAGTGHRICNDCMRSCIYQKQDPVDIPQIETRILKDVLNLPWGFEIYGLLTRWNPLNLERPLVRPETGKRVLVVGLGPAGYTLAHHLMNDGHMVVAIDGLKIEPLPPELSGIKKTRGRTPFRPIRDIAELQEDLGNRVMAGFGGVAEYGITVRWDKNFLKILRLLVQRRTPFSMLGGVRFGGTLSIDDAFERGFDHIALAVGAGRPTLIPIPMGLVRGVRAASDFLMGLQLTGAARDDSVANLQVRLPAVVVGGGLTAIDTATEVLAYYPLQVEKFLMRYETLIGERGEETVRAGWDREETAIADEFISHARAIRAERAVAEHEDRPPHIFRLLKKWGGVTIAYRKRLIDSPSYTLNHEEVEKALGEGIEFAECLNPISVLIDEYGHASHLTLNKQRLTRDGHWLTLDDVEKLPAPAILIAAGTQPNTVLAREEPDKLGIDDRYFQAFDMDGVPVEPELSKKPGEVHVLANLRDDGRAISFFGDLHPSFAGNVVGAMASARQGYALISEMLQRVEPANRDSDDDFMYALARQLHAEVHEINRLTGNIIEVVIRAPQAARKFQPGQFYRLQNYETSALAPEGTRLAMEGLALTGASVDREKGLVSLIVLEMGGSSSLCAHLKPGEPVSLMGPTGAPTEIPEGETVLLCGGGLGNAVLFSIGQAMRAAGSRVLYFAGYKTNDDRYKVAEIEAAADTIVWCCDEAPGFAPTRAGDKTYVGNIVEAMVNYSEGNLGEVEITLPEVDRAVVIGSHGMMAAVADAFRGTLAERLKDGFKAIASINSPMQCMMKEICAQCVQTHVDPETGLQTLVFSCFNQDQPLDRVHFNLLGARLRQNSVQEKLTAQWIEHCLAKLGLGGEDAAA